MDAASPPPHCFQPNDNIAPSATLPSHPASLTSPPPAPPPPLSLRIPSPEASEKTRESRRNGMRIRSVNPTNRIYCGICKEANGFRGQHEFERHFSNKHGGGPIYVCIDVSPGKDFLSSCRACREGRIYNMDYNAAAHLRRQHFKVKRNKKKSTKPLEGTVKAMLDSWGMTDWRAEGEGRDEFDMKFCRQWMQRKYVGKTKIREPEVKFVRERPDLDTMLKEEFSDEVLDNEASATSTSTKCLQPAFANSMAEVSSIHGSTFSDYNSQLKFPVGFDSTVFDSYIPTHSDQGFCDHA